MICPECGTYQPDRAKFCGICGTPLSQDSLVETFLREKPEQEIVLPRYRSPWFYVAVFLVTLAALALLAGSVYLVYRVVGKGEKGGEPEEEVQNDTMQYYDEKLGYGFSYPDGWTLEQGFQGGDELSSLRITMTSRKFMEIKTFVFDPVVAIGGLEGIREYLEERAREHIRSLGGGIQESETGLFTYTRVGKTPAFYVEFEVNLLGEATTFILCYVVGGDYCFQLEGRAPNEEYRAVRPLFWSIIDSIHQRSEAGEGTENGSPTEGRPNVLRLPRLEGRKGTETSRSSRDAFRRA